MTYKELLDNDNYYYHHSASRRGYVSRRCKPQVEPYKGRFGEGYIVVKPRWDTTQYVGIEYHIKNDN